MMKKLGIAGPPGSGKDTIAEHLVSRHGFTHVSTGDLLRGEAGRLGLDHKRSTLQSLGASLRQQYGYDQLFAVALEQAVGRTVFTGIRTLDAVELLQTSGGSLMYVDAPVISRYERCVDRNRESESGISLSDFIAADGIEYGVNTETDMVLGRIITMAQFIIHNTGTPEELFIGIDNIITKYD